MPAAPFDAQRARRTLFEALLEAAREHGMTYSAFMGWILKAGIEVDRKMLAELAGDDAAAFTALVDVAKANQPVVVPRVYGPRVVKRGAWGWNARDRVDITCSRRSCPDLPRKSDPRGTCCPLANCRSKRENIQSRVMSRACPSTSRPLPFERNRSSKWTST